jgi:hypothetical protein
MTWGRPHVIVKDNNRDRADNSDGANYFLLGLEHGMDVTAGTIETGGAMGDLSGYKMTLTGMERIAAPFIIPDPDTAGFTIVPAYT